MVLPGNVEWMRTEDRVCAPGEATLFLIWSNYPQRSSQSSCPEMEEEHLFPSVLIRQGFRVAQTRRVLSAGRFCPAVLSCSAFFFPSLTWARDTDLAGGRLCLPSVSFRCSSWSPVTTSSLSEGSIPAVPFITQSLFISRFNLWMRNVWIFNK